MIILVGIEKGGPGKTTLATQLAAMRAMAGHDTVLVDGDKQCSASDWSAIRADQDPSPVGITCVSRLGKSIATDSLKLSAKFDTVVIDAGGRDNPELRFAMAVADLIVMPIRPGQFDAWPISKMVALKKDVEEKTDRHLNMHLVINAASTNPSVTEVDEIRAYLRENYADAFPLMDSVIGDRISHRRAARDGLCVAELKRDYADPKAVKEMSQLYAEVFNEQWQARA